jgi:putative hydrolase of the HAD superfamily
MPACVLFDLDDTLYPEREFVRSGFDAVAAEIERRFGVGAARARRALEEELAGHGRGQTIDRALERLGLAAGPEAVAELVAAYRSHRPDIALFPDALRALQRLGAARARLGLVTDGDPTAQRSKARALGLAHWMGAMCFTWDAGPEYGKPHPRGFECALAALGASPEEAVYVGDNPTKDFSGARRLGLWTVRLRRGPFGATRAEHGHDADLAIDTLDELEVLHRPVRPRRRGAALG